MKKKTAPINLMIEPNAKKKLKEKSTALGLSLTGYFEKIAYEDVVFLDDNVKKIISMMKFSM